MAFLQEALDDPSPQPCGRCSVCTGNLPAGTGAPEKDSVIAARNFVRGVDVVLEPRKKWPPGSGRKGFIAGVAEGRVVAFADDPGWQEEIAEFNRSGRTRIPQALLDGAVPVLTRWRPHWATRPVAVVPCAAPGARFRANQELAAHIAAVGKLPVLDVFVWSGDAPSDDLASAPMVDHLLGAISLRGGMEIPREPVLLVSATARSRWILTVAGSLLRDAGCAEVFPLVIHQRP
jgi:ATP-dependent DNA helicase RecQ